jgi:hypothetical protein
MKKKFSNNSIIIKRLTEFRLIFFDFIYTLIIYYCTPASVKEIEAQRQEAADPVDQLKAATAQNSQLLKTITEMQQAKNQKGK